MLSKQCYLIVIICFILHHQVIFSAEEYKKDRYDSIQELLHDPNTDVPKIYRLLEQEPTLVCTDTIPMITSEQNFTKNTTLAHFLASNPKWFSFLQALFCLGETAAKPITQPLERSEVTLGVTAFYTLCQTLPRVPIDKMNDFLSLLSQFAQRTPHVVSMSKADGMTPAMIIASSRFPIKVAALEILYRCNNQAFDGETVNILRIPNFQPRSVVYFLTKSPNSQQALTFVLQRAQNINPSWIDDASKSPFSVQYIPIIQYFSRIKPSIPLQVSRINDQAECLCCQFGCRCCSLPSGSKHSQFWATFYNQHPEHPNATGWLNQYYDQQT